LLPGDVDAANIVIDHAFKSISLDYHGVALAEGSHLIGWENIEFFTLDAKGDVVPMPVANRIVRKS